MAFQTACKVPPARLWGDGENPGGVGSGNHGGRVMLKAGVVAAGCGAQSRLQEMPDGVDVFSHGTLTGKIVAAGHGWQPNGR